MFFNQFRGPIEIRETMMGSWAYFSKMIAQFYDDDCRLLMGPTYVQQIAVSDTSNIFLRSALSSTVASVPTRRTVNPHQGLPSLIQFGRAACGQRHSGELT